MTTKAFQLYELELMPADIEDVDNDVKGQRVLVGPLSIKSTRALAKAMKGLDIEEVDADPEESIDALVSACKIIIGERNKKFDLDKTEELIDINTAWMLVNIANGGTPNLPEAPKEA